MMRLSARHIIHNVLRLRSMLLLAVLPALAALMTACDSGDKSEPGVDPSDGLCRAGFYITTGDGASLAGRAPSPGEYEPGNPLENLIDIDRGDFKVLFFDSSDLYLGTLTNVHIDIVSSDGSNKTYRVSGTMPAEIVDEASSLKFMMLANWRGNYPELTRGVSNIGDVAMASARAFRFGPDGDNHPDLGADVASSRLIPMYGVSNLLTGLTFEPRWQTDLGTLHMLRAFAKVRVRASEESFALTSVKLTHANTALYQGPVDVKSQDDYKGDAWHKDYYRLPSVPQGTAVEDGIELYREANGDWVTYLPEFENLQAGVATMPRPINERCRLEVMFEYSTQSFFVDFKYYSEPPSYAVGSKIGDHFDVLRNNIYDFTLQRLDGVADLQVVEVDVIPYGDVKLQPEYGLDRDPETGWIIIKQYDDVFYYADKDFQYYDKNKVPVATRVEMNPERTRFNVRWPKTGEVMYVYDITNDKYYTDETCTTELTTPEQLFRFFTKFIDDDKEYYTLRADEYGRIIYLWDVAAKVCRNSDMLVVRPTINHGFQLYKGERTGVDNLVVIKLRYDGLYQFFYDYVNDKYYRNVSTEPQSLTLIPCDVFPPK